MKIGQLSQDDRRYVEGLLLVLESAPLRLVQIKLPTASAISEVTRGVQLAVTGLRTLMNPGA
jgi:hypothetical protein